MLEKRQPIPQVLIGFDGFIDTIKHPIRKKYSPQKWDRIETLEEFAKSIQLASGKSANIECIEVSSLLGGNAPLCAQAMAHLGVDITLIASLFTSEDDRTIDPAFSPLVMLPNVHPIPIHSAGRTDALEFYDGKILLGNMKELDSLALSDLFRTLSEQKLSSIIHKVDALAILNWTMMPLVDSFLEWLLSTKILSSLSEKKKKNILFIDFADPKKRIREDLAHVFSLLQKCAETGHFDIIISVNFSEAQQSLEALQKHDCLKADLPCLISSLHDAFPHATAIIGHSHTKICGSWIDTKNKEVTQTYSLDVPFIEKPYATTGAGDSFNGGVLSALVYGYSYPHALLWGAATSGIWVRSRMSAPISEVEAFIHENFSV